MLLIITNEGEMLFGFWKVTSGLPEWKAAGRLLHGHEDQREQKHGEDGDEDGSVKSFAQIGLQTLA